MNSINNFIKDIIPLRRKTVICTYYCVYSAPLYGHKKPENYRTNYDFPPYGN